MLKRKKKPTHAPVQALFEPLESSEVSSDASLDVALASPLPVDDAWEDAQDSVGDGLEAEADPVPSQTPAAPQPVLEKQEMDNVALVFLDSSCARRLAVAWPVCKGNEETWFEAAGLTNKEYAEARRISRALRLHGICRDGGVTDKLALQYITAVIVKPVTAKAKKE